MQSAGGDLFFRVADPVSSDYERIAELLNIAEGIHVDPAALRNWDANKLAEDIHVRYVACLADEVIGYGVNYLAGIDAGGCFLVWLTIDPAWRRQGYGGQFYDFLEAQAVIHGAVDFGCEVLDNDAASLAFAERRGYMIERHSFASRLDLRTFDVTPLLPIVERLQAEGIRFSSLAAEGNDEAAQRKLFALNAATDQDNPGNRGEYHDSFENFQAKVLQANWFRAEGQILAVGGERFVGLSAIGIEPDGRSAFQAHTGVDKNYRGRGIAQALKILAAQYAQREGAQSIVTQKDSANAPMLAVNQRLGYVRQPGPYWLVKQGL